MRRPFSLFRSGLGETGYLWSTGGLVSETGLGTANVSCQVRLTESGAEFSRRIFLWRDAVRARPETPDPGSGCVERAQWVRFHRSGEAPLRPCQYLGSS